MHKWLLALAVLGCSTVNAQYYYNDILGNRNSRENYMQLKTAGVKEVTVTSYDPDGTPTQGFSIKQTLNTNRHTLQATSQSAYSNPSVLTTTFSATGWPISSADSTDASVSRINYTYNSNAAGELASISTSTGFPGETTNQFQEQRIYTYSNGKPVSMVRLKNGKDSLQIKFIAEEHGWIGEERWMQKGKLIETYYYYYDAAGKLTDVAHYHQTARRILPDYAFEYDGQGKISSMITFINGTNQYRTWRYTYDARGLKTQEVVFNKYKQQEGKLVYSYQ